MKKIVAIVLIALTLLGTASAELYVRFANVIDFEWDLDLVSADDGLGNIWEFFGCDHFYYDDLVVMIMDDRGTPDWIYDDVVRNAYPVRY